MLGDISYIKLLYNPRVNIVFTVVFTLFFAIITVYIITYTSITSRCSTLSPFIFKNQCGNVTVLVEQPILVHFTDEENVIRWDEENDYLQTETVKEKLETGTDEGSSVSDDESTCRLL